MEKLLEKRKLGKKG